jgi:hypothetical protein
MLFSKSIGTDKNGNSIISIVDISLTIKKHRFIYFAPN